MGDFENKHEALRPFVVGLIGHRELAPTELKRLQEEFDEFLSSILKYLRFTPVLVLTSIAKGADRLAYSSRHRNRIRICSVLPMSDKEYERDFPSKSEREQFRRLLEDSDYLITFNSELKTKFVGAKRNKAYKECADWISDNSNSLFAIWDGKKSRGVGGTADTVQRRLNALGANSHFDQGGISFRHALASNSNSRYLENCGCSGHKEFTESDSKSLATYDRLNAFLLDSPVRLEVESLRSHFELFDKKAVELQRVFTKRTKYLLTLGVLTVNLASIQLGILSFSVLAPTLLLLMVTVAFWTGLSKSQIKNAYETYRLLAEVLRVQIWWQSCGLKSKVLSEITELRETDVITRLLLTNTFLMEHISSSGHPFKQGEFEDPALWIEHQKNYLALPGGGGAIRRSEIKSSKLKKSIYTSVFVAGASLVTGTLYSSLVNADGTESAEWVTSIIFTFSLSIAAAQAAYSQVMSFGEMVGRYRTKEYRLQNALIAVKNSRSKLDKQKIAREAGVDSLSEAFRWFQTKSDRQVRPFQ